MIKVRKNVFETNSSSTHSITMCTSDEYDGWLKGEYYLDRYNEVLVPKEQLKDCDSYRYYTYSDYTYIDLEKYEEKYTTKSGEVLVAFGYYEYDG